MSFALSRSSAAGASQSVWADETEIDAGVAHTARWTAAMRAMEHSLPNALFSDPLARAFAGESSIDKWSQEMQAMHDREPDKKSHIAIRARAIDDVFAEELEGMLPADFVQVVSLGAGMCTRPWRIVAPETDVIWFEVDRPDSMRLKASITARQDIRPSVSTYCQIGVDFSNPEASLTASLEEYNFDKRAPTIFIMEGVLPYLTVQENEELVEEINELCQGKVRLIMTVINNGFLHELKNPSLEEQQRHPGTQEVATLFHTSWEDGIEDIFAGGGWSLDSIISREDYAKEYLGVEMLTYTFPDRRTSTEYIVVWRRNKGVIGYLRDAVGLGMCT
jgi:methyltransferase (TIGR00027 family)